MKLKNINIEKVARAIEADAGVTLPNLRASLRHAKHGQVARSTVVELTAAAQARAGVGLSQSDFAALMGVSPRTLQDWEQGRREPTGAARTLLRVAAAHPAVLRELARTAN